MEEMTEDPVPKRPRSVKSSAEDTPAVMTYEQLQARNIRERKEKFRKMGFDKLKDELAARKKKPFQDAPSCLPQVWSQTHLFSFLDDNTYQEIVQK